jgi:hypothetical protein
VSKFYGFVVSDDTLSGGGYFNGERNKYNTISSFWIAELFLFTLFEKAARVASVEGDTIAPKQGFSTHTQTRHATKRVQTISDATFF